MAEHEVQYIMLSGGKSIPAERAICPECKTLNLHTAFDTSTEPLRAICPKGHSWPIKTEADA